MLWVIVSPHEASEYCWYDVMSQESLTHKGFGHSSGNVSYTYQFSMIRCPTTQIPNNRAGKVQQFTASISCFIIHLNPTCLLALSVRCL